MQITYFNYHQMILHDFKCLKNSANIKYTIAILWMCPYKNTVIAKIIHGITWSGPGPDNYLTHQECKTVSFSVTLLHSALGITDTSFLKTTRIFILCYEKHYMYVWFIKNILKELILTYIN